ncbi:MAG: hypothetical protein ACR5LD_11820 [Symbiopectobacterium sp.]
MEQHKRYAMTALSLDEQRLLVNRVSISLKTLLRIRINAVYVSLVLQNHQQRAVFVTCCSLRC